MQSITGKIDAPPTDKQSQKLKAESIGNAINGEALLLHSSIQHLLVLAQNLGLFPVQGVRHRNHESLKFRWQSPQVFYSLTFLSLACIATVGSLHGIFISKNKLEIMHALNLFVFTCVDVLCNIFFIMMARRWPKLMTEWYCLEQYMTNSIGIRSELRSKLKTLTWLLLFVALVEHMLTELTTIIKTFFKCTNNFSDGLKHFFINDTYHYTYGITDNYPLLTGITYKIVLLQLTFSWNFIDVFIAALATALTFRINQLSNKIEDFIATKPNSVTEWKNLREEYNHICFLSISLDKDLSCIVLLSYCTNLYFLLFQLYFIIVSTKETAIYKMYLLISLLLLIIRVTCVTFYGASINEECKRILPQLNSITPSAYNLEIHRFIWQLKHTKLALTGNNFFKITRGLLLNISTAVVTYVLILLGGSRRDNQLEQEVTETESPQYKSYWLC